MTGELEAAGALATAGVVGVAIEGREGGEPGNGNCPNCDAPISGRFCSNCGQHSYPNRKLTGVLSEFMYGLWNFDTKAWRTIPMLIVRPGTLTRNYVYGKRARYLAPLTMFLFAIFVMFGAAYTFKRNEHVRVEILYLMLSERAQLWLDLIGTVFFLIPACLLLAYLSWPFFHQSYAIGEMSSNAGGLVRWPIKFVVPAGFVMLALQGVSEAIKRIAALQGYVTIDAKYERPTQ